MGFADVFSKRRASKATTLEDYWSTRTITESGLISGLQQKCGFMFEAEGLDASFLTNEQLAQLHNEWRSTLRLLPGEEVQIVFRKRVEFSKWVENQLSQAFLSESVYGRRLLLERLSEQVSRMSRDQPQVLSQKIILCFWTQETLDQTILAAKRDLVASHLNGFGFPFTPLNKIGIENEIALSAHDSSTLSGQIPEWPFVAIEAGHLEVGQDRFRALELRKLPEQTTELGMIQAITRLPYPMDLCIRLKGRDARPMISSLERKRKLLSSKRGQKGSAPDLDSQIDQINQVLRCLADSSDQIFDFGMTIGVRFSKELAAFQRSALAELLHASTRMNFCEFEESTLGIFDSYLECIPGFSGRNIQKHTVLGSNAVHFLPFFRPSSGDPRNVVTFQTREGGMYGLDPVDGKLANYNWLVSGTSGAGKSFFVNSLLTQSFPINPNIFIVDIGGSYNKLVRFLGGKVMSLEPNQGFELSPLFLPKSDDEKEEQLRRQHIYQIFLEMIRTDESPPSIEIRHLLSEVLDLVLNLDPVPKFPISALIALLSNDPSKTARRLQMLLKPWGTGSFFGQFLDNNRAVVSDDLVLAFDLKGLTEFEPLSRVVQLIICAALWARIRRNANHRFSWIVLDEVAFSLLKFQPQFVDELVSTLRKHFGGVVIVVQDLEKVSCNIAGSSILQNTQSKAILQQRGDPRSYADVLGLNSVDRSAIASLRRKKGAFSDIFLIRDDKRTVIRHAPGDLEYWLATTAPEDVLSIAQWNEGSTGAFQKNFLEFVSSRRAAS